MTKVTIMTKVIKITKVTIMIKVTIMTKVIIMTHSQGRLENVFSPLSFGRSPSSPSTRCHTTSSKSSVPVSVRAWTKPSPSPVTRTPRCCLTSPSYGWTSRRTTITSVLTVNSILIQKVQFYCWDTQHCFCFSQPLLFLSVVH